MHTVTLKIHCENLAQSTVNSSVFFHPDTSRFLTLNIIYTFNLLEVVISIAFETTTEKCQTLLVSRSGTIPPSSFLTEFQFCIDWKPVCLLAMKTSFPLVKGFYVCRCDSCLVIMREKANNLRMADEKNKRSLVLS